jgi:3-oxoacyl-[acyl-carrier protein] reductase
VVIIITGTRKGIGRYLAEYYLAKGYTVLGCSRERNDLENEKYYHFQVDVSDEKSVNKFFGQVRKTFKVIDALINNAGAASMNHFLFTPAATAKRLMELNYLGTYHCVRAFINLLKKSKNPRIINFTTVAVPLILSGEIAYVSSKSAVEAFTRGLAKELAPFNITVNAIGPTPVATDLTAHVPKEKLEALMAQQAIHRMGDFQDISNVIDFYLSPASNFITGQIIYLGGVN